MSRFAAALSLHPESAIAAGETLATLAENLDGRPDLIVAFVSGGHTNAIKDLVEATEKLLNPLHLITVSAMGVLSGTSEIENEPAISMWAGQVPGIELFRLDSLPGDPPQLIGVPEEIEPKSTVMVLADPFTTPITQLITQFELDHPSVEIVGGLVSVSNLPNSNSIAIGSTIHNDGGVGVIFPPTVARPLVSQGCRPIGAPWVVTQAEGQMIQELGSKPAMRRLGETIDGLKTKDRNLASQGLHVGLVAEDRADKPGPGDFLIRAVVGADPKSGSVAIGDQPKVGQVVQFQVRDASSASDELNQIMDEAGGQAALVFTCNGRGKNLFGDSGHDASRIYDSIGGAVAGAFCAGELGPVAGRNALHGYTATVLVFD